MVEIIVMIGVVGNFLLQLYWFLWSQKIHEDSKHEEKVVTPSDDFVKYQPETVITPNMREQYFNATGQFSSDAEIAEWFKKVVWPTQ